MDSSYSLQWNWNAR